MLKFITEEYLKDLYRKEPFINFDLKTNERLTPGGRQYLLDKGIKMNSNLPTDNQEALKKQDVEAEKIKSDENLKEKKLLYKLKALEALFLSSASEMLNEDIKLTQKIIDLGRHIKGIREFIEGTCELEITTPKNSKELLNLYYLFCKLEEFKYEVILDFEGAEVLEGILKNIYEIEATLSGMIKKEAGEI
ncbi:MAG: cobalamin adenosyltransferase [Clostridium perfringens]|nr:cobalamin adenosyltransferase [Clostridium perfringens]